MTRRKQHDAATVYAKAVVAGTIIANRLVRLACERHLHDLKDGKARGLVWNLDAANDAIDFFGIVLRLAEGAHAGAAFALQPWQAFIVGSLFGWQTLAGVRRFRTAYLEVGKGNGKTPLAAGLGLLGLTADNEAGAQVYAAAVTRDQAGILFRDAERMVAASPALMERVDANVGNLAHAASGSFFRPVSSEARSLDGKRVHMALIDELHEHPTADVVDKMRAGTKGRRQALIVEITNSGYDRQSVCFQHHTYSEEILEGRALNDSWFAYVCGLDAGDDWRDEKVWIKANPNLGVSLTVQYLREQVTEAKGMPAKQNLVRRLNFCEWTEHADHWIEPALWAGRRDSNVAVGQDTEIVLGFDGSYNRDSTALVGCTISEKPHLFVIGVWERPAGLTDWTVPRDDVLGVIEDAIAGYKVARIAADDTFGRMWSMDLEALREKGVDVQEWPTRSLARIAPAAGAFFGALKDGRLSHDGNAHLAAHIANCVARGSRWGLVPVKASQDSTRHIDLAIAAIIAYDVATRLGGNDGGWDFTAFPMPSLLDDGPHGFRPFS